MILIFASQAYFTKVLKMIGITKRQFALGIKDKRALNPMLLNMIIRPMGRVAKMVSWPKREVKHS
jgi:hypothetical protein